MSSTSLVPTALSFLAALCEHLEERGFRAELLPNLDNPTGVSVDDVPVVISVEFRLGRPWVQVAGSYAVRGMRDLDKALRTTAEGLLAELPKLRQNWQEQQVCEQLGKSVTEGAQRLRDMGINNLSISRTYHGNVQDHLQISGYIGTIELAGNTFPEEIWADFEQLSRTISEAFQKFQDKHGA